MLRSITKEILVKKTYRFEDSPKLGVVHVFVKTNCNNENYLGWVMDKNHSTWIEPEIVEAAKEFLKDQK